LLVFFTEMDFRVVGVCKLRLIVSPQDEMIAAEVGMLLSYIKQKHLSTQISQSCSSGFLSQKYLCCVALLSGDSRSLTETQYTLIVPTNMGLNAYLAIRKHKLTHLAI
jgi:hypothetical protein